MYDILLSVVFATKLGHLGAFYDNVGLLVILRYFLIVNSCLI